MGTKKSKKTETKKSDVKKSDVKKTESKKSKTKSIPFYYKTRSKSVKRKASQCRIKYMYLRAIGASKKGDTLYLGTNDDAPIVSKEAQIWMICRPAVEKEELQYYYIFDELGRVLTHRICGDSGNVILENVIDLNQTHSRWMIDNVNKTIQPYDNHLLSLDYDPNKKYGILVRRSDFRHNQNQTWQLLDRVGEDKTSQSRARVWEYSKDDIADLFVSYQNSKLLQYAKKLPCYGYVKVDQYSNRIFCYIDVPHWNKYAEKFREKIIQHYDFRDSSSLYYFVNKYYPFIVKHHNLTPKSKMYLATDIYKKGYHISLYQNSKTLVGKKIKFKCVSLNHLVNRSYTKLISAEESQYKFTPDRYHGIAWFFIETDFTPPMTCYNSQMPIPHLSVGLILYEPPKNEITQK
jgi:hypothetical protein